MPGHYGIPGNERADQLAREASSISPPSPELTLPVWYSRVRSAIRSWAGKEANGYWQDIKTCRQTKQMIQEHSRKRARNLLNLDRNSLHRTVHRSFGIKPTFAHYGLTKQPILWTLWRIARNNSPYGSTMWPLHGRTRRYLGKALFRLLRHQYRQCSRLTEIYL